MYFSQRFLKGLGCLSYVVGDEDAGDAAVVDPQLSIDEYVREAEEAGLRIRHVLDTHLHADHVSGARALAQATGATLHLPEKGRAPYLHEPLREGSEVRLGDVVLRARETPGHTPEHVTIEVLDLSAVPDRPYAALTGDTLLVGSAGRPDLVGAAGARDLAVMMQETLTGVFLALPDGVLVYPGHGPGSACGSNMGLLLQSSLGYEKDSNPYLGPLSREEFVERLVGELPPKPGNAENIKRINAEGPPERAPRAEDVPPLAPREFARAVGDARDVLVLDVSEPDAFAANHVPGSINVAHGPPPFPNRAAKFLEWGKPVLLVLPDDGLLADVALDLARVGGLDARGHLEGGVYAWRNAGLPLGGLDTLGARELAERLDRSDARLLDVRSAAEWRSGHVEGATWVPWEELPERVGELDPDAAWAVTCASGYRSGMAASLLAREGFPRVANVLGGMTAWRAAGLPLVEAGGRREAAARPAA